MRNSNQKKDRKKKKEIKREGVSLLSSSDRECSHYIDRCIERSGFFLPLCRKKILRLIKMKEITLKAQGRGKLKLIFKDGRQIIVNKKFKAITYLD